MIPSLMEAWQLATILLTVALLACLLVFVARTALVWSDARDKRRGR